MTDARSYVRHVWRQKRLLAAWPPIEPIEVGDIFKMERGVPVKQGNLRDRPWEIMFEVSVPSPVLGSWMATSQDGTELVTKGAGHGVAGIELASLPMSDAGLVATLTGTRSFILAMHNITKTSLADPNMLTEQLTRRWIRLLNGWNTSWLIASEVYRAERSTFIAGASRQTQLEFRIASGLLSPDGPAASLAADASLTSAHGGLDLFVARSSTPLFRSVRLSVGGMSPGRLERLATHNGRPPASLNLLPYEMSDDDLVGDE